MRETVEGGRDWRKQGEGKEVPVGCGINKREPSLAEARPRHITAKHQRFEDLTLEVVADREFNTDIYSDLYPDISLKSELLYA